MYLLTVLAVCWVSGSLPRVRGGQSWGHVARRATRAVPAVLAGVTRS